MTTASSTRQAGQALVLITLFMFSLLGMCALAIDVGAWYQQKRAVQSAADAGALAGAANLPTGWSAATGAAGSEFAKNLAGATVTFSQRSVYVRGDSIEVTASKPATTYFARVLTSKPITTTVSATATFMNAGGGALPWGVIQSPYVPGRTYPIYTDNRGPNNGALRLPGWDTASSTCTAGSIRGLGGGAELYSAEVSGGVVTTCPVRIGDVLQTKTGQNTGPTSQGVADRCGSSLAAASTVVTFNGTGAPTIKQPGSCQLVLLPVVVDASTGASAWPAQGAGDVRVVGFSWWVITAVLQGGKEVDAVYVGDAPTTGGTGGALPSAFTAQLTG
jgi:Flp pilus assembly protein TadG